MAQGQKAKDTHLPHPAKVLKGTGVLKYQVLFGDKISGTRLESSWKYLYIRIMKVSTIRFCLLFAGVFPLSFMGFSQNNALVMNGAAIVLNGGTVATPIYLVVNQTNTLGITYSGTSRIVSENQYNFVQWNCGTGTGSYVVPFGVNISATDYSIPFTFDKTTAGSSTLDVSTWHTNNQNVPHPAISNVAAVCCMKGPGDSLTSAIDRFWDIRTSAATTANLTFKYAGPENTTAVPGDLFKAQHWNGTKWDPAVGPGVAGVTTGVGTSGAVSGQSTFSPWVLTRGTAMLPIELISFTAACKDKQVEIKWSTASEINNDFFTVERSADAVNYLPLGTILGAGNSSTVQNYSFTDVDPLSGTSFYRIKQTDFNGYTETFPAASISPCVGNGGVSVVIGNGLNNGNIWVSINDGEGQDVLVGITDVLGRRVYLKELRNIPGSYLLNADLQLAPGVYVVNAATASSSFSKKIVVVR